MAADDVAAAGAAEPAGAPDEAGLGADAGAADVAGFADDPGAVGVAAADALASSAPFLALACVINCSTSLPSFVDVRPR